jgi:hypothetical protein
MEFSLELLIAVDIAANSCDEAWPEVDKCQNLEIEYENRYVL